MTIVPNFYLAERVLLGEVSAGLVDHSAEVPDVVGGELAPDRREADPVPGGDEGGVDSVVGNAKQHSTVAFFYCLQCKYMLVIFFDNCQQRVTVL